MGLIVRRELDVYCVCVANRYIMNKWLHVNIVKQNTTQHNDFLPLSAGEGGL